MRRFRSQGKQVLADDEHYADAADKFKAIEIVNALRALESNQPITARLNLNECRVERQNDEMTCRCGLRWSVDDPNPPLCVHRR